jgi:fatty acid desaturase
MQTPDPLLKSPEKAATIPAPSDAASEFILNEKVKINWYRTKVDKSVMSRLMKRSDAKAMIQCVLQVGLFAFTATLCFLTISKMRVDNLYWSVPALFACIFLHGTCSWFMGLIAVHELVHKTPFRTQFWNDFFLYLFSFLSWSDPVWFRCSHVRHHQVTGYHDLDHEVPFPQKMDWDCVKFWFWQLVPFPKIDSSWNRVMAWIKTASKNPMDNRDYDDKWFEIHMPGEDVRVRQNRWARAMLAGHLALALIFIATGNWYLILIINLSCFYCPWLYTLCVTPQHIGMTPNSPDFRLVCRTFTCGRFLGFLYWNMQYHIEHHMFPAVPFYNLPALRRAIEHDMPPATHGLWATWREIIPVLKKQREDPSYTFAPDLPSTG